jgi:hypothetical protein
MSEGTSSLTCSHDTDILDYGPGGQTILCLLNLGCYVQFVPHDDAKQAIDAQ